LLFFKNKKKITSFGLNLGIKKSRGDFIIRMDAHSLYPENYVSKLVKSFYKNKGDNVGGVRKTIIHGNAKEKSLGIAVSHFFSAGNAFWRTGTEMVIEAESVFGGCYKKSIFKKIGYFNEDLERAQDREFNFRIRRRGGKIILDPGIESFYFPRIKLGNYLKWIFSGGFWVFYSGKYTDVRMLKIRNYLPLIFLLWHFTLLFFIVSFNLGILFLIPFFYYLFFDFLFSLESSVKHRDIFIFPLLFFVFPLTHYLYALGSLYGLVRRVI
jgi:glycosyltransferase involved in cell wall biosynthesis